MRNLILLLGITFLIATTSMAQHAKYVNTAGPADFEGYDLVSYFSNDAPIKGDSHYQTHFDGLTLYFASQENLNTFEANPEKFLPAYGGYCATAVSHDNYVTPNFTSYTIQDDKLLLFEVKGFFNGKTHWHKDPQLFEILADKHYRNKFDEGTAKCCD